MFSANQRTLRICGYSGSDYLLYEVIHRRMPESALLETKGVNKSDLVSGKTVLFPSGRYFTLLDRQVSGGKKLKEGWWSYRDPVDITKSERELDEYVADTRRDYKGCAPRTPTAPLTRLHSPLRATAS